MLKYLNEIVIVEFTTLITINENKLIVIKVSSIVKSKISY